MRTRIHALLLGACLAVLPLHPVPVQAQLPESFARGLQGMAPADYYVLLQQANRQIEAGQDSAAVQSFERVVRAYPWDGESWRRLGVAHYRTRNYPAAARAFLEADRVGNQPYPQNTATLAARSLVRSAQPDAAIASLQKAMYTYRHFNPGFIASDTAFAALATDPRFTRMFGDPAVRPADRDERWRQDLDYLLSEVRRMNGVFRGVLPDSVLREAGRLREEIPRLSDVQVMVGMQRVLAMLGQSHNGLFIPLSQVPVKLYSFTDGVYVVHADSAHRGLIGMRVESIGGRNVSELLAAVDVLVARDHRSNHWGGLDQLTRPELLHALGLVDRPDSVRFALSDRDGGQVTRTLGLSPGYSAPRKLLAPALPGLPAAPLYLSRPDDYYWFERLAGTSTAYVQFNQVINKPGGESIAEFGRRLRQALAEQGIRTLVVDLRRNNGGDTYMYPELLRTLIAYDAQPGNRLYVIIGRFTYSAAMNFITDLDRLTDAVFVGEPSGGSPIQYGGDESATVLPNSGLRGALSSSVWQLTGPRDTRGYIVPALPVALSSADYFNNRDSVLETVLQVIRNQPVPVGGAGT